MRSSTTPKREGSPRLRLIRQEGTRAINHERYITSYLMIGHGIYNCRNAILFMDGSRTIFRSSVGLGLFVRGAGSAFAMLSDTFSSRNSCNANTAA
jgi:hypothetical protein